MGLLDDAIREHLDLKRRRGADPTEIERAEQEALGPVRREPIANEEAVETVLPEASPEIPAAAPPDSPAPPVAPADPPVTGETFGGDFDDEPAVDDDDDWDDLDDDYEDEDGLEPGHHDPGPDAAAGSAASGPPAVPDAAPRTPGGDALPGEDDVLEETPEFLQDTPDHDRLWFEQRPPKDFDFDE